MKRTLVFALALAVIPVGVDAQSPDLEALRALAEQGDATAQYTLGNMYADGEGVPEDLVEAVRWYRLAAEQGGAEAQYNLGVLYLGIMYEDGRGVPEDLVEAVRWFRLAAEQGGAEAQYNLGVLYATGQGVPQDNAEAVQLVAVSSRARECGCPDQPRAYVRQWRRRAGGLWRCPNGSRL